MTPCPLSCFNLAHLQKSIANVLSNYVDKVIVDLDTEPVLLIALQRLLALLFVVYLVYQCNVIFKIVMIVIIYFMSVNLPALPFKELDDN